MIAKSFQAIGGFLIVLLIKLFKKLIEVTSSNNIPFFTGNL